jgi:hypothetical protein
MRSARAAEAAAEDPPPAEGRDESPAERLDRNFGEMLQELRVAQTGVQILFAFLLTAAFSARAAELSGVREAAYVVSVVTSALAACALMAPVVIHRVLFRHGEKDRLVAAAQPLTLVGMALLGVSIVAALWLVLDLVVGGGAAVALAAACGVVFVLVWIVLPALLRTGPP